MLAAKLRKKKKRIFDLKVNLDREATMITASKGKRTSVKQGKLLEKTSHGKIRVKKKINIRRALKNYMNDSETFKVKTEKGEK